MSDHPELDNAEFQALAKEAHAHFTATVTHLLRNDPDQSIGTVLAGMAGSLAEFGLISAPGEMDANEAIDRIAATVKVCGLQIIEQVARDK